MPAKKKDQQEEVDVQQSSGSESNSPSPDTKDESIKSENSEIAGQEAASGEEANDEDNDEGNDEEMDDSSSETGDQNQENSNEPQSADVDPIYDQTLMKPLFERRDKSLKELLNAMDEFSPIIPDAVIDYYLNKSGFKSGDHRIKRLLALATQKFVADIANDAYQFSKIRAQTANTAGGAGRGRAGPGSSSGRTVLTMESLSGVLGDYGINANRPDFYR